jgi:hypothetical protein
MEQAINLLFSSFQSIVNLFVVGYLSVHLESLVTNRWQLGGLLPDEAYNQVLIKKRRRPALARVSLPNTLAERLETDARKFVE